MSVPAQPKIYHIVHVDRLPSIIADGGLWSDAEIQRRSLSGTTIGMDQIKQRRLNELTLNSHPGLFVGACVPFYFCPRSIMLYLIYQANHRELTYRGGQDPIVHLEIDLQEAVQWSEANDRRWAFTLSNAGAYYFEDRCDLADLHEIDWEAVAANHWSGHDLPHSGSHGKQAEFLVETSFPWGLVKRIGVVNRTSYAAVVQALSDGKHKPRLEIRPEWYYP
jgi:hypothetical protein